MFNKKKKTKIEFCLDKKILGDNFYYTNIDNRFVANSGSFIRETAYAIFIKIIENGVFKDETEIIEVKLINQ